MQTRQILCTLLAVAMLFTFTACDKADTLPDTKEIERIGVDETGDETGDENNGNNGDYQAGDNSDIEPLHESTTLAAVPEFHTSKLLMI